MKWSGISFRTEEYHNVGVYRTSGRIGVIYHGTDNVWCFCLTSVAPDKAVTISIGEIRDIIGMMGTLDGTDNYGNPIKIAP